ncbi:response regulator [Clostridium sp. SHJSY1]|uniref:response regulator transcription factor n=1 Tax=Clostridium sp. SHJSY1 TaxID=2942483 RepID=UPI0028748EA2|nr:response regulator [Clostridium sp. SHJSY1]MDS0527819.1 response regulator [Clostridium sp. SHJSY1]
MLNVLIIDDEPNVRLGLRKIVPWEENGFRVCGEGVDAEDGFEKIINLNPDIVLIDIKMPGKLGTDVIRDARKEGFRGKFVIVSGYSNFEYAKDAIKYGVKSYILKPIDEDELIEILLQLAEEIKDEKKLEDDKPLLKEINLKKIIFHKDVDIEKKYFTYENFQLALVSINSKDGDNIDYNNELIQAYLKNYDDIEVITLDGFVGVLFEDVKKRMVKSILKKLASKINEEKEKTVFITVGEQVNSIKLVYNSYKRARNLMDKKFLYLEEEIIFEEDEKKYNVDNILDIKNHINKIYSFVEVNDMDRLNEAIMELKDYVIKREYSEKQIKIISIEIFLELKAKLIKDYNLNEEDLLESEEIIKEIYSKISLDGTINYLLDNFMNISKKLVTQSAGNSVKRIINYMEKNYYKDLKLESLANIFNYNSAYLGKLLKSTIGESFNTHLDKIRIEKAKKLLVNDKLKVYQVCEKVGYKNIDYFHSKFKKYVGTSPRNYKKENENGKTLVEIVDMAISDNA